MRAFRAIPFNDRYPLPPLSSNNCPSEYRATHLARFPDPVFTFSPSLFSTQRPNVKHARSS